MSKPMGRADRQPPHRVGDECALDIHDLAFGGRGVGRLDGYTVFVPFTIPGERVRVCLKKVKPRFAEAELLEVLCAADTRVQPPCPWFGRCAGCQYQHMTYAAQLAAKTQQVRALLARIGGVCEPEVSPIVPAPNPWAYRNKISLHGPGAPAYVGWDHNDRVPIDTCAIAEPALNVALAEWRRTHPDGLAADENVTLRSDADGRVWARTKPGGVLMRQRIAGIEWHTPVDSFFQVHPAMTERLVDHVHTLIKAAECGNLIDAYAGVGLFGLSSAPYVDQVYAIESDPAAVRAAMRHAEGLNGVEIIHERVESVLAGVLQQLPVSNTLCLIDPPRTGCHPKVLDALGRHKPQALIYISCAPDRLARDIRVLVQHGYILLTVQPFDMFPQTTHIEVVAQLVQAK